MNFNEVYSKMGQVNKLYQPTLITNENKILMSQAIASVLLLDNKRINYKKLRQDILDNNTTNLQSYSDLDIIPVWRLDGIKSDYRYNKDKALSVDGIIEVNKMCQEGKSKISGVSILKVPKLKQVFNTKIRCFGGIVRRAEGSNDPLSILSEICLDLLVLDSFKVYNRRTVLLYVNILLGATMGYPPLTNSLEEVEVEKYRTSIKAYKDFGNAEPFNQLFAEWLLNSANALYKLRQQSN